MVTHRLPQLNKEEAGAVVFLGHDPKGTKCDDIAANPEVSSYISQALLHTADAARVVGIMWSRVVGFVTYTP